MIVQQRTRHGTVIPFLQTADRRRKFVQASNQELIFLNDSARQPSAMFSWRSVLAPLRLAVAGLGPVRPLRENNTVEADIAGLIRCFQHWNPPNGPHSGVAKCTQTPNSSIEATSNLYIRVNPRPICLGA